MVSKTNLMLYVGIAVVVAVVAFAAAIAFKPSGAYSVSVEVQPNGIMPATLYPFRTVYFTITINNTGRTITNMPLSLYLNGALMGSYKVSIPARESATINENYTFTGNGTFEFDAVADPGDLLNIANRQAATGTVTYNVIAPQHPDLYTFLPNSGTADTHSFTLFVKGVALTSVLSRAYNVSAFSPFLGPSPGVMSTLLVDLVSSRAINLVNGVSSTYSNGTSAYGLWIQGTLNATDISTILGTYPFGSKEVTAAGNTVFLSAVDNTTSICTFNQNGWTKLLEYYNASAPGSCASVVSSSYAPTVGNVVSSMLGSSHKLNAYSGNFVYTNSSSEGVAIDYNPAANTLTLTNLFQNGYGSFASSITRTPPANVLALNDTCDGLVYADNSTGVQVCSVYVPAVLQGYTNDSLVDSSDIMTNYTLGLYSFVNSASTIDAHYNAAALISALGINETSAQWHSAFRNSCAFTNVSVGCSVLSFNATTDVASISIRNGMAGPMRINALGCYLTANTNRVPLNATVAPGASVTENMTCSANIVPIASATTSYVLAMNYTEGGTSALAYGTLNATNIYLG